MHVDGSNQHANINTQKRAHPNVHEHTYTYICMNLLHMYEHRAYPHRYPCTPPTWVCQVVQLTSIIQHCIVKSYHEPEYGNCEPKTAFPVKQSNTV